MSLKPNRRELLAGAISGVTVLSLRSGTAWPSVEGVRQSVCRWCYQGVSLDRLAAEAARIGYRSVELLGPEDAAKMKQYGLTCAMLQGTGPIDNCFNRIENHDRCVSELRTAIDFASDHGLPNVICFSGNRKGMDDEEGLLNCVKGLKRIAGYAEAKGVTVCLELLNSKVDHKDYMADHTNWGVRMVQAVGSNRVKLLYDIYHMQIMEGDVIRTIQENKEYIGHFHTGGVPGRNEIDQTQELNYPAIVRGIVETGYEGFIGQEFVPKRDPLGSLAEGFEICNTALA